jgi:hypothetical protein
MKKSLVIGGIALCAALVSPFSARANLLPANGGLELASQYLSSLSLTTYGFVSAAPGTNSDALLNASNAGWSITSGSIDIVNNSYWQSAEGSYSVDLIGTPGVGSTILGSIAQTVTGLTSGQHYQLSFDFAVNPETMTGEGNDTKILDVSVSNSSLESPAVFTGTVGTRTKTDMQYAVEAVDFVANSTSCTITFAAAMPTGLPAELVNATLPSATNLYCGPVIDNIDLELAEGGNTLTPEPASLGILGAGGLVLLRRKSGRAR